MIIKDTCNENDGKDDETNHYDKNNDQNICRSVKTRQSDNQVILTITKRRKEK